jgi:hypothetical protein
MGGLGSLLILLIDQPVFNNGGRRSGNGGFLSLDLDGHGLVLLQVVGEVSLLGRFRCLRSGEGLDLADAVRLLDWRGLVGLELFEVELLDEIGCNKFGKR